MTPHLLRILAITALLVFGAIYPFLPGEYDRMAVPVSWMAQALAAGGLLLVPVGILWLWHELRRRRVPQATDRGYAFAVAALFPGTLVALVVTLVGFKAAGPSVGLLLLLACLWFASRLWPAIKRLKARPSDSFSPAPFYLLIVPVVAFVSHLLLAAPATEWSRQRAMAASAELIRDIERYRSRQGQYPVSLLALHPDYRTCVVGIEKFHYAPNGSAYDLFFEQPRFVFDQFGARELVGYNRLGGHLVVSHAGWVLDWPPEQLRASPGWYASHSAGSPNWRIFLFD